MELKVKSTLQDKMDVAVIVRKLGGLQKRDDARRRIIGFILMLMGFIYLWFAFRAKGCFLFIVSIMIIVLSVVDIVFATKINIRNIRRSIKRNLRTIGRQYDFDFTLPTDTSLRISDGFLEVESLFTVTKFPLAEYVRYFAEDRFFVFEFKRGRYVFIHQADFPDGKSLADFENLLKQC